MDVNMKDKLRELRKKKNVTQEALANHLGITPQSVGKWERGEGFPDITLLPAIAGRSVMSGNPSPRSHFPTDCGVMPR